MFDSTLLCVPICFMCRRHDGLIQTPAVIKLGSFRPVFPSAIETELVIHLLDMQSMFVGLCGQDVRMLAFELVMNNTEHRFDLQRKMAAMLHPELSPLQPYASRTVF